jgi:hypothetical protein
MTIRDIHILIEQGLQKIGVFAYADMEHDEIDLAIDSVTIREIRNIFKDIDGIQHPNNYERNQYEADFLRILKEKKCITATKTDDGYSIDLPTNYLHLISDSSNVIALSCNVKTLDSEKEDVLEIGKSYRANGDVLHNGKWYKNCEIFVAETTDLYGKVTELATKKVPNRLTKSENIGNILNNSLTKSNFKSPVSELIGNTLTVYADSSFKLSQICITYVRLPKKVSYYNDITIEFPEDVQYYLVDKVVQHISIRIEESQQKIVNLKSENIENS